MKQNSETNTNQIDQAGVDALYEESGHWHINTGDQSIYVKRMAGRFRNLKWLASSVWLIFLLGPYLRWDGQQAVLLDIVNRQFHIFNVTILPQDVWLLALVLLFFSMLLAAVTSVVGRVFCGYFCFQTVWTDLFTWLDTVIEGPPAKRAKLDKAPWDVNKLSKKVLKHTLWILIGALTGVTFTLWFSDAYELWQAYFTLDAPLEAWISVATFTCFTYLFAGFMREQVCFWLCPYARIQGVMYDTETLLPTYDVPRGEPRGKLKKSLGKEASNALGDCIDCKQCVAVCPTGIDIRHGQQEGCITCGLCIDACDSVMDKVGRPRSLIRYLSLDEVNGKPAVKLYRRPRVLVYLGFVLLSVFGLAYGLTHLGAMELTVIHERQPLYVIQSDGSIQNRYELKILNKTDQEMNAIVSVSGHPNITLVGAENVLGIAPGKVKAVTVFLKIPGDEFEQERAEVIFNTSTSQENNTKISVDYTSMFFGPAH